MAAFSVLAAWVAWATAFLSLEVFPRKTASFPEVTLPKHLGWRYFPATVLGPRTAATPGSMVGSPVLPAAWAAAMAKRRRLMEGMSIYSLAAA
jgi:hypothetical protein